MVNLPVRIPAPAPERGPIPARLAFQAAAGGDRALLATAHPDAPIIGVSWSGPVALDLVTTPRVDISIPPTATSVLAAEATATTITKLIVAQALRDGSAATILSRSTGRHWWANGLPRVRLAADEQGILDALSRLGDDLANRTWRSPVRHVVVIDDAEDLVRLAYRECGHAGARHGLDQLLGTGPAARLNVIAVAGHDSEPHSGWRRCFPVRITFNSRPIQHPAHTGTGGPVRLAGLGSPIDFEVFPITDYQARRWATACGPVRVGEGPR